MLLGLIQSLEVQFIMIFAISTGNSIRRVGVDGYHVVYLVARQLLYCLLLLVDIVQGKIYYLFDLCRLL